ncbi:MAG: sodium:solute symporter [Rubrobacteraceae bacterium]
MTGKNENSEDYFLGSRNFIWPLIGLSLFATNMSGSSFVGLAGAGYNSGISVYSYEFMVAIILVIFIFFVLPFYLRSEIFTIPEFLERRYDRRTRLAFSGFNLFTNMFIDMAVALYAGALVFQTLFPAVPLWISVIVLALLAGVYTIFGGLGAVVISDSLQAVVLIIGGALVFIMTARAIPSWQAAREAAPEGAMHIIQPIGDDVLPWPGLITGVLIIGIYYWTTNQLVVQRTLGARSIDHGRWGSLFCGFLKLPVLFIMVLPGTLAVVLYPDLQSPDLVFPTLAFDLLPIGVRGIILAALVAAITSSVDSVLNSVSTLVTMDFVKSLRPDTSERTLVQVGRVATLGAMIVAIVWAPQITNFPTLWQYLQSVLAYVTPPIVAVFLLGIFWGRVNQYGAITTLAVGIPLGVVGFVLNEILGVFAIQFLYAAGISFATSLVLLTVVSLLSAPPPREQVEELTWRPALWREETEEVRGTPLWKNYRFLSIVLLISTVTIVYIFR